MADGRAGAGGRHGWIVAVLLGAGCLTRQHVDDTTASTSEATTDEQEATLGGSTMLPELMTTTESPDTTAGPGCDDEVRNQDESDVDCGGACPPCDPGRTCEDNDDCATHACAAGVCVLPGCAEDDECAALADACNTARCVDFACAREPDHEGAACDDEALCSTASACAAGVCTATATVDCTAFDSLCTAGLCDPDSGACVTLDTPDGMVCDDGDGCTPGAVCSGGACVANGTGAVFFEDFEDAAPDWQLGPLWAIGPAAASTSGIGGADPAMDHSEGDDNRLAGVVIGGLDTMASHAKWCLTSPPVDTEEVVPNLYVSFWRHLHAPAQPQVIHTVEVWNGATWKNLETGYANVVDDAAWTFQSYNASGQQAADFRLRVCVERKPGASNFAGWSVDDVTFAAIPCTP